MLAMPPVPDSIDFHTSPRWAVRARSVFDATGRSFAPGQIVVEAQPDAAQSTLRTVSVGHPSEVGPLPILNLPDTALVPAFVNAHTHLDLTLVGPRPRPTTGGFSAWLQVIREHRPQERADIAEAVGRGIDLSLAGGVVAVGDIAGCVRTGPSLVPWQTLRESRLGGVSFLEFFAFGSVRDAAMARLEATLDAACADGEMLGLQPHAPYSVSKTAYEAALVLAQTHGLALTTHLAETLDERTFVAEASGPQRAFLDALNLWHEREAEHIGKGEHPVRHLAPLLGRRPWLLAHLNDCSDEALDILSRTNCSVAYCPRASAYFDAPSTLGPHRYRDMLARGVNVCLGTDSIVNLPHEAANRRTGGITPLADARLLYRRDGADPLELLAMLTINGARALGLDEAAFAFSPGRSLAGLVAIPARTDTLAAVFADDSTPRLLAASKQVPTGPQVGP